MKNLTTRTFKTQCFSQFPQYLNTTNYSITKKRQIRIQLWNLPHSGPSPWLRVSPAPSSFSATRKSNSLRASSVSSSPAIIPSTYAKETIKFLSQYRFDKMNFSIIPSIKSSLKNIKKIISIFLWPKWISIFKGSNKLSS